MIWRLHNTLGATAGAISQAPRFPNRTRRGYFQAVAAAAEQGAVIRGLARMLNDDSKLTQQCCLVFDGFYELLKEEKATIASALHFGSRSLPLTVLIRTPISVRRILICNPI
jgi:hypothetical protein